MRQIALVIIAARQYLKGITQFTGERAGNLDVFWICDKNDMIILQLIDYIYTTVKMIR